MTERTDDVLDREIDAAAKELTDGSPRPGFSQRVRSRIEAPRAAGAWGWRTAAAVAAALALTAYLVLPRSPVDRPEGIVTRETTPSTPAVQPPEERPDRPPDASPLARAPEIRPSARRGNVARVAPVPRPVRATPAPALAPAPRIVAAEDVPQIAALVEPAPLVVRVEAPEALTIDREIAFKNIAVPDLSIAPLDPELDREKEPR